MVLSSHYILYHNFFYLSNVNIYHGRAYKCLFLIL
nr:MAG TPA: hypothetical protein [Caudoviricetes sp.]